MELIKFNLFDNTGTYKTYVYGAERRGRPSRESLAGDAAAEESIRIIRRWAAMRQQVCKGDLIRGRTLTGICNDILQSPDGLDRNAVRAQCGIRNHFPGSGPNDSHEEPAWRPAGPADARPASDQPQAVHPGAIESDAACNAGFGLPGNSPDANCDYQKAPFFNVLAAYWIQFMTHDWFSHMEDGHNAPEYMDGAAAATPNADAGDAELGCRPGDRVDKPLVLQDSRAGQIHQRRQGIPLARAEDFRQQQHGVVGCLADLWLRRDFATAREARSGRPASLLLEPVAGTTGRAICRCFRPAIPIQPQWAGQEACRLSRITGPSG